MAAKEESLEAVPQEEVAEDTVKEEHTAMDVEDGDDDEEQPTGLLDDEEREALEKEIAEDAAKKKAQREAIEALKHQTEAESAEDAALSARFKFLQQSADIFAHFMKNGKPSDPKAKDTSKQKRRRLTEKEEDETMLKDSIDDSPTHARLTKQPAILQNGTLRYYQLEGLNWMVNLYNNSINGILADEMGLGKTVQTVALLAYLKEYRKITGPHMVIVPKSTLANWQKEFAKWCPCLRVLRFHGSQDERAVMKEETLYPKKFDVCLTTYEVVNTEKAALNRFSWRYIVIDEAHRIKNENSLLARVVRMYDSHSRLLLTGTPLQNNLHELWALLNFLLPDIFNSDEDFDSWFQAGEDGKSEAIEQLHKILRPFLLRRLKVDVEKDLPPKKETVLYIGMAQQQQQLYKQILIKDIAAINGVDGNRVRLLNIVMQLRKCCNHPYLFDGQEPGPPYLEGEHLIEASGKMVILDKLLPRLHEDGHRVLIFSQMTRMMDILEDYLHLRGFSYCRIDGSTSGVDRDASIEAFNAPDSKVFIFLLSTRAGGLGINLATADTVILYDSDWNPQADIQAQDRAHRIGQKKPVNVYRFVIEKTIEQRIMERAMKKLYLDAMVVQQGRLVDQNKSLGREELLGMIRYGADEVIRDTGNEEFDIEKILERGAEKTAEMQEKYKSESAGKNSMANFTVDYSVYNYDGVDYSGKGSSSGYFLDLGRRERSGKNMNVSQSFNNMMKAPPREKRGPKAPGRPVLHDFQFYDTKRLNEIFDKEHVIWQQKQAAKEAIKLQKQQSKEAKKAQDQEAGVEAAAEEDKEDKEDKEEDEPEGFELTAEEKEEKERLLSEGFSNWKKNDFNTFIKACEKHGRANVDMICQEMTDMDPDNVRAYAKTFTERYMEVQDWERYIKQIERGEQKLERKKDIMNAIKKKVESYTNPWVELKLAYGQNKGKGFTEENDRYLICMTNQLGYGKWDEIKWELRKAWEFRFDWYIKSRMAVELNRRVDTLVRLIEKEQADQEEEESNAKRKRSEASAKPSKKEKVEAPVTKTPPSTKKEAAGKASGGKRKK